MIGKWGRWEGREQRPRSTSLTPSTWGGLPSVLLGMMLALMTVPSPWDILTPLSLAALFRWASTSAAPRAVAARLVYGTEPEAPFSKGKRLLRALNSSPLGCGA